MGSIHDSIVVGHGAGTAGGATSPSASAVHGPSTLSAANNHTRMVSQGGGKRHRRTERNGKLIMMSQDFSGHQQNTRGIHVESIHGLQKTQDFGQRGSQRRVKHQVKGLQPHIQISDQQAGLKGRNESMIGSSYAFAAGNPGGSNVNPQATTTLSSVNKYDMYKNSGRQYQQVPLSQKPPRAVHHRLNNFFQYSQGQKNNSKLSAGQYSQQNPQMASAATAGSALGGADPRSGSDIQASPEHQHMPNNQGAPQEG